ncbi:acyl-CoA dehydrogenase family protein [Bacillus testis]|uniref:acyl-CoA dehydrogenase family protein n=1 Tax=Bacillus testis TaxID=1622072 RepID=UPI00067F5CF3|nr:acyl-CoA dehydrogenase family protein [Bacillus testis]
MEFSLNDIQEEFKSTAGKFFAQKCSVAELRAMENSEMHYSPSLYKELADLGFLGLAIPEEYGGMEGSMLDLAIIVEEAGWASLPSPFVPTLSYGILPLLQFGTEMQKKELLPLAGEGKITFTGGFSEQQAHYDMRYITAKAERNGDSFVLSGNKLFVPFAATADYMLTLARTESNRGTGEEGLTLFLIDMKREGITVTETPSIGPDGLHEVQFNQVMVSEADVIGTVNGGWEASQQVLQMATALNCIEMAGVLRRAVEVTSDYVKERIQFGRPIGSFQSVQHRLADMYTIVEGGKMAAYQAIWRLGEGLTAAREISIAKAYLSKEGQQVLVGAHQLHGGMGLDMDYPLQFCFRRFKNLQLSLGTPSVHLATISQSMASVKENEMSRV